jgi:hypothetical protein
MTEGVLNTSPATKYRPPSDNNKRQDGYLERREDIGDPHGGAVMNDYD